MKIFLGILIFFLAFGWLVLLLAATGLFYTATVVLSIIIGLFVFLRFSLKNSVSAENPGKTFFPVIFVALVVSFFTCHFATPTVFGGRDQGAIATAAIELSQNHSLKIENQAAHDLFQKYGLGRALNFPGFDYTKNGDLISRFPIGYTAFLASYFDLFGLKGIQYANFVPLFLFLVIFWLILRQFFDEKIAFLGYLAAATFFPFQWFAKYALTEIYMLYLVWAGIYFLIALRRPTSTALDVRRLKIPLAFFALASLVRIEGMIFFLLAALYVLLLQRKNIFPKSKNFNKYLLISALLLFCFYIYLNFPALLDSLKNFAKAFLPNSTKDSVPSAGLYGYLFRIFTSYNILPWLVLGLAGIAWLATKLKKNWWKFEFLPFFVLFPAFFYLLTPQITLEDPWLLRRFVFAVFPALIFYSIYALEKFFYHKVFLYITLIALLGANVVVSARFFTLSENKDILPQVEKLSQKFGPNDLVLVDRLASGSGYSLLSEPLTTLIHRQAAYFFNAEDLKYINQDRYDNIFLVAPIFAENPWYAELVKGKSPVDAQIISNNFLEPSEKKFGLAVNVEAQTLAGIWKIK